jgi:hypothetical protein
MPYSDFRMAAWYFEIYGVSVEIVSGAPFREFGAPGPRRRESERRPVPRQEILPQLR